MFLSLAAAVTEASAAAHRQTLSESLTENLKHPVPPARLFILLRCALVIRELLPVSVFGEKKNTASLNWK